MEHLEAYVLALEKNLSVMASNVSKLSAGASKTLLSELEQPLDLTELKANISIAPLAPANSFPSPDGDMSTCDDHEHNSIKMEPLSPVFMAEKNASWDAEEELPLDAPNSYFNYLSPESLHSPIDLTLKQESISSLASSPQRLDYSNVDQHDSLVSLPTSGPDLLAQNSEVILFPIVVLV